MIFIISYHWVYVCSYTVQQEANCTFDDPGEDGLCSFEPDFSRTVPWRRVPQHGKTIDIPSSMLPIFDHTTMSR